MPVCSGGGWPLADAISAATTPPSAPRSFTDTSLALFLTLLNSATDLLSFAGILFTIYPPLFAVLLAYSIGGTAASITLGKVRAVKSASDPYTAGRRAGAWAAMRRTALCLPACARGA